MTAGTSRRRDSSDERLVYRCYGITLVAKHELPGLLPDAGIPGVDVFRVDLDGIPPSLDAKVDWSNGSTTDGSTPLRQRRGVSTVAGFEFADGFRFAIDTEARCIVGERSVNRSLDEALVFLVGPVLGYLLRRLDTIALHASAVAIGERALLLVGPSGAGKSTLAAAFSLAGRRVLSDDIVALDLATRHALAYPGYPALRLRPEAVATLFGSEDRLPRFVPAWERRCLSLSETTNGFQREALPVGRVVLLEPEDAHAEPRMDTPAAAEALARLSANSYGSAWLDGPMRRRELADLGKLVSRVPVSRLRYSRARDDVHATVQCLLESRCSNDDVLR